MPNRFTSLRQFEIWTCNDQAADCSTDNGYQRAFASGDDAFPADAPRPVVPMLLLREFTFSPVRATHLRIVVRNSQCTSSPAYQGEQDADPENATDCDSAGPASTHFVRIAEVQAFNQQSPGPRVRRRRRVELDRGAASARAGGRCLEAAAGLHGAEGDLEPPGARGTARAGATGPVVEGVTVTRTRSCAWKPVPRNRRGWVDAGARTALRLEGGRGVGARAFVAADRGEQPGGGE